MIRLVTYLSLIASGWIAVAVGQPNAAVSMFVGALVVNAMREGN